MIIFGVVGLVLSAAFGAAASSALRRTIAPDAPLELSFLIELLFFTALQMLLVLGTGLAGLLAPLPLTLISAFGLGALAFFRVLPPRPSWRLSRPDTPRGWVLAGLTAALAVSLVVKVLVLSPYWGDALYYHLPNVAEWVRHRRLVYGFMSDVRIWFPMGFELVETWWVVFLGRDTLIEAGGVQMLLLAAVSVRVLARAHDLDAPLAGVVFAFTPALILHATSCGNDLASGALVLAAYALVSTRMPRALQVFPLLLGAGIKPTAIFAATGVLVYSLRTGAAGRLDRRLAAVLLSAGLVLGGFWYARNAVLKGHPLYPVYGSQSVAGLRADPLENFDTLRRTLEELPRRMLDRFPFSVHAPDATSWGWFVLPWGVALALIAVRSDPRFRGLAVAFTVGWFTTIALSPMNQLNLRFAVWFPAIFALAAGRKPGRLVVAAAVAASLLNFVATLAPLERTARDRFLLPDTFPRGEPIACLFSEDMPSYLYYNGDFSRRLVYPASREELKASGVRFALVWDAPAWAPEAHQWKRVTGRLYEVP
ncbi:MAG TPA: hypothetical protein VKW04_11860 [Planctomycetota bacterium]|nr:hypothetical protein [Planctomycetota bacterium]